MFTGEGTRGKNIIIVSILNVWQTQKVDPLWCSDAVGLFSLRIKKTKKTLAVGFILQVFISTNFKTQEKDFFPFTKRPQLQESRLLGGVSYFVLTFRMNGPCRVIKLQIEELPSFHL